MTGNREEGRQTEALESGEKLLSTKKGKKKKSGE